MKGDYIYRGFWTNHEFGPVYGKTLTVSANGASFLVAFLALFVSIVGSQFWGILRFLLHQNSLRGKERPVRFFQQQAVLRNDTSMLNAIWDLSSIAYRWYMKKKQWNCRDIFLPLAATVTFAAFATAGVFSSQVSKSRNLSFLLRSSNCSNSNITPFESGVPLMSREMQEKATSNLNMAAAYVRNCVVSNNPIFECQRFKQNIVHSSASSATCPFGGSICSEKAGSIYRIDTGYVDSHIAFGFNAPKKDRMLFRKVSECAVLKSANYSTEVKVRLPSLRTYSNHFPEDREQSLHFYEYGLDEVSNITVMVPEPVEGEIDPFTVHGYASAKPWKDFGWLPVRQLQRENATVSLIWISSGSLAYPQPVDDPLFSAHIPLVRNIVGYPTDSHETNLTLFSSDQPASFLGCVDQYQLCKGSNANGNPQHCTPLISGPRHGDSRQAEEDMLATLKLSQSQRALATIFLFGSGSMHISTPIIMRGSEMIRATEQVVQSLGGVGGYLPPNQLLLEMQFWFDISLISFQEFLFQSALGDSTWRNLMVSKGDLLPSEIICNTMLTRNGASHQNFSVLGLTVIFAVGGLIILVSFYIETITSVIVYRGINKTRTKAGNKTGGHLNQWYAEGKLQLQRAQFESAGIGSWDHHDNLVPVLALDCSVKSVKEDEYFEILSERRKMDMNESARTS